MPHLAPLPWLMNWTMTWLLVMTMIPAMALFNSPMLSKLTKDQESSSHWAW